MAVTTPGTFELVNLVQTSELDPKLKLVGVTSSAGDGTGGLNQISWTIPTDLAVMVASIACQMSGSSTSNVAYLLNEDGVSIYMSGAAANLVDTTNIPDCAEPPAMMIWRAPTCHLLSDNVAGDTMTGHMIAFGWDLQIGRNIPQRFFWPGLLS